ncbi:hypothetical protein QYM36_011101 [Artemia franciscana]|uniref:Uncharacterized protein n=1 Tax=Artemia franciscana TaxID=6661 RepID=A0AA88HUH4_ARTSF|nr:hypothetical protein QYM36_011101 [Artemia franciscana]
MPSKRENLQVFHSNKNVSTINEKTDSVEAGMDDEDTVFLYAIKTDSGKDEALVPLKLNKQMLVSFKIDTEAQANVIPKSVFNKLAPKPNLLPTNQQLTSYYGARIPVICTCTLPVATNSILKVFTSSMWLIQLLLLFIVDEYKSVFEGIGRLEGERNIHPKVGSVPTVHPGCYRFLRMPSGELPVQDELQRCMEEAFEGLEGIAIIIDDILVYGSNASVKRNMTED